MKTSQSRTTAATTPRDQIESGSPEEAYQAINRAKMLWSFRRRDIGDWKEVIDRWVKEPKAWHRIPEMKPYGTAKAMIEAEVCENYDAFVDFIKDIVDASYAAKIVDNHADRPGPKDTENRQRNDAGQFIPNETYPNVYTHKHLDGDSKESKGGTRSAYLLERIAKEHPAETENIGKGKPYKTVNEAARKLGIVADRERLYFYADDPVAAGRYLAQRVNAEWMQECYDAFLKERS